MLVFNCLSVFVRDEAMDDAGVEMVLLLKLAFFSGGGGGSGGVQLVDLI